jgi:type I restriction enzyme S subunit
MTNKNSTYKRLGDYIREVDVRNTKKEVNLSQGICNQKYFQNPRQVSATPHLDKIVRKGQFAYNRATTRNGNKISIAYREGEDCTVSSAYCVFYIVDENILNPYYLWLWFKKPDFDRYAIFKSHGSAHEFFEFETLCDTYVPIPSIEEQRKIVDHYLAIQNRIANNKQTIAKLEEAAQALYRKMFVDDVDVENLPDGWRMGTIEEISEKIVAGTIPKYDDTSSYMVLGQKCNKNGILDLNLCKRHIPKDNCLFLQKKDILVNSTGDGTLGRVGQIWFEPEKLAFDSNMTLVRPLNRYSEYLGCVLLNKQDYFVQISQGSTNQTRLYCSMIKPVPLIIPSDIILYDFSKAIKPMKEHVYLLYKENEKLTEMLSLMA